jgi:threonine synthase
MGLPLRKLLMPTNANDEFPRFLKTGVYRKVDPSRKCISNAMNVGHPSNLARFFDIYGGNIDRTGEVIRPPDLGEMRKRIFSLAVSDRETRRTIVETYQRYGVILEPHGAVGWRGLEEYLAQEGGSGPAISVETAHPAKFPEEIESLLGIHPPVPASLQDLESRQGSALPLPADYSAFKDFLLSRNPLPGKN